MNRIIFQNGTLVSKAKVTVNGTVYDVEPEVYEGQTPLSAEILNQMQELLIEGIYPVGSIYMSTRNTNPATLFGVGTWERWGKGKVPVGIDENDEDFDEAEETGGNKTSKLRAWIGATNDDISRIGYYGEGAVKNSTYTFSVQGGDVIRNPEKINHSTKVTESDGNEPSRLQPYITCYMWKRIS